MATVLAGIVRRIRARRATLSPPLCVLCGGETTVTPAGHPGARRAQSGIRPGNLAQLGVKGMKGVVLLSGGTDGEDGPTDAAGAVADATTLERAATLQLSAQAYLQRHDAYAFFAATGDLLKTGLTQTNVMDVRSLACDGSGMRPATNRQAGG